MNDPNDRILIVDDDPRNTLALSAVLRAKGFTVEVLGSAGEALERLRAAPGIKVVLLDMMMPDMDGYEALAAIRGDRALSDRPVFAVTAQAMAGDRERCLQAGASEYISKPVDVDLLLELLQAYKVRSNHEG